MNIGKNSNISLIAKTCLSTALSCRCYLILHGFPATFDVPICQDDALFVHSGLLLPVLFKHSDFQATTQDDGSITYTYNKCTYKFLLLKKPGAHHMLCKQNRSEYAVERLTYRRESIQYLQ